MRPPLSRERALSAAVALADSNGIDAVSMRRLAERLDVVPMALYKHLANKDELLGGMVDTLIAEYERPPADAAWPDAVRAQILSARRVLLRHPWARRVIESRGTRTPAVLGYMDSLAGLLIAGGLSVDLAHHAMHALGHRIWGFSPEAFDTPGPRAAPPSAEEAEQQMRVMGERYPHVLAIALESAATGGACDEQYEFEFTLDLLLAAFQRLHETGWSSRGVRAEPAVVPSGND